MAAWTREITLTDALGVSDLSDAVGTLAASAGATLDVAGSALDAAKLFLTGTASPEAAAAAQLVQQAQNIVNDLFGAGFFHLAVHPWTPALGRGEGPWRNLDFPRLVRAMVDSFDDAGDGERPQFSSLAPVEMITLVAGAPSPALFRQVLETLNALLDLKEFRLALRRLEQAFRLEQERFQKPLVSRPPDWQSVTVREAFPALRPLEKALKRQLALLAGYAAGGNKAVDIAIGLIDAKRQQLQQLQDSLADAMALFGQGSDNAGLYALHVAGQGGNALLKDALTNAGQAPGPELSFCAGVCWVGPQGSLAALKGILGL